MSFLSAVKGWFTGAPVAPKGLLAGVMMSGHAPRRGTKELLDAYRTSPWLHAIVHRISMETAQQRLEVYAPTPDPTKSARKRSIARLATRRDAVSYAPGNSTEVEGHPFCELLDRPNPGMTRMVFMHLVQSYLDVKGECPIIVERGRDGRPASLWVVPPHWLAATPSVASPFYRFNAGSWCPLIPESDVIYMRHPDLNNPYARGIGTAESASDEIDIDEYATAHLKTWFFNRAIPDMFLSIEGVDSESEAARYQEMLRGKYGGARKGNQVHVTSGKVELKEVGHTFKEQQLPEIREQERDFLLQLYGMPPEVMGIIANSNRATIDAARYLLMTGLVVPRLVFLSDAFTGFARAEYGDETISVGFDSPVPEDRAFRQGVFTAQPGLFTKNEWRELAGMRPIQGWDTEFPAPSFAPSFGAPALPSGQEPPTEVDGEPATDGENEEDKDETEVEESKGLKRRDRGLVHRAIDPDAVARALQPERLERVTKRLRQVIDVWGTSVLQDLGSSAAFDLRNPLVKDYLDAWQEQRIVGITDTTRADVTRTIQQAVAEGEGIDEIKRRVRGYFDEASNYRAECIARTEVVSSANAANLAAYQISGLVDAKEWLAVQDDSTRDTHRAMDGQRVTISDEFQSPSGKRCQGPGLFGTAEEDINCRCVVRPVLNDNASPEGEQRAIEWRAFDAALAGPQKDIQGDAATVFGEWLGDALKAIG